MLVGLTLDVKKIAQFFFSKQSNNIFLTPKQDFEFFFLPGGQVQGGLGGPGGRPG